MITYLAPLPVGNAVRGLFVLPDGASEWKVLRKTALPFTGVADAGAAVIYDGPEKGFVDITAVANGTLYYYLPYYLIAGVWTADAGGPVSTTAAAIMGSAGPDPQALVRDRLEWGLKNEVAANRVRHKDGMVPVLSAPPVFEDTQFPIVTVHLEAFDAYVQGVGALVAPDVFDGADWLDNEGGLFSCRLLIVCWTVDNPDERIALRAAVLRQLLGNLPVFASEGLVEVAFSATDREDFQTYGAPVYQSFVTLTCIVPLAVEGSAPPISDVTVFANAA